MHSGSQTSLKRGKYFLLGKDCFLVKGAKQGAIYDLSTGDVYSVDSLGTRFIEYLEKYLDIETAIRNVPRLRKDKAYQFLNRIQDLGLGTFRKIRRRQAKREIEPIPNKLNFMWLELTDRCNLMCRQCYSNSIGNISEEEMRIQDWRKILKDGAQVGCEMVQFLGGEPFLIGDDIFKLISLSQQLGYKDIEIFTNATLLNDERIDFLHAHGVRVAVTLYCKERKIHDQITRRKGSFDRTIRNIKKMKDKRINLRISVIAMKQNQDYIKDTISFIRKELGIDNIDPDLVRPLGRGCNPDLTPHKLTPYEEIRKPQFAVVDEKTFAKRLKGHSCFFGTICITANGDCIPCPMERERILGNVRHNSLAEVLKGDKVVDTWSLSKDRIDTCRDCEYRYACFDCRPKVKGQTGDFYAKPPNCFYDPHVGKWIRNRKEG